MMLRKKHMVKIVKVMNIFGFYAYYTTKKENNYEQCHVS